MSTARRTYNPGHRDGALSGAYLTAIVTAIGWHKLVNFGARTGGWRERNISEVHYVALCVDGTDVDVSVLLPDAWNKASTVVIRIASGDATKDKRVPLSRLGARKVAGDVADVVAVIRTAQEQRAADDDAERAEAARRAALADVLRGLGARVDDVDDLPAHLGLEGALPGADVRIDGGVGYAVVTFRSSDVKRLLTELVAARLIRPRTASRGDE